MAAPTNALSSLLQRTTLDDHDEVLQAADQVLKSSKGDSEAQFAKVVALLKLDRYDDALKVFESGGERLKGSGRREYAYALYKAGKLEEAEEAIGTGKDDRGSLHVLAQVLYRSEKFEQAAEIYKLLKSNPGEVSNEENDLRINTGAVDAQLEWNGAGHAVQNKKPTREDLEGFETAYNAACGSIARGELSKAEVLLSRAKDLCNALDELTDEEKKIELLPIIVQQIFVLTRLGKLDQAKNLLSTIDVNEIPDQTTRQIAQINSLPLSHTENPYLAQRIFSDTEKLAEADKPFNFQQSIIRRDAYVLALNSLKYEGVARSTATYIKKNANLITSPQVAQVSVLNAAAHAKGQTGKAALKEILPLLEKRPTDVGLLLTVVQIYLSLQNLPSATNSIESFIKRIEASSNSDDLDVRFNPGLVGTLASLYAAQGRKSNVQTELLNAASYWLKRSKNPSPSLLRAAGTALLKSQKKEDLAAAGDIFSQLHTLDSNDKTAIAGLVASYSTTQPDKITSAQVDSLPPVDRLIAGIDAAALEDAGIPVTVTTHTTSVTPKKRSTAAKEKSDKAKKVRTSRLPKDYDPNKKPDPERWLPLRDRTYYKPKGKKGKAKAAGLTQGGVVADDKSDAPKPTPAAPTSGGGGGAAKKKKKGKGGKW